MTVRDSWSKALIVLWAVWFLAATPNYWLPLSFWYTVRSIHVANAFVNQPHYITFERDINRPFFADWTVTVRQRVGERDGEPIFRNISNRDGSTACIGRGSNDYTPNIGLPERLTLRGWYMDGQKCYLSPGAYITDTIWTLRLGSASRIVRLRSNVFLVMWP